MAGDGCCTKSIANGTGLVYDEKLTRHYCAWNPAYTERPERVQECYKRIQQLGLVERCVNVPVRLATDEEAALCHTQKHMDMLKETEFMTTEQLSKFSSLYDFVYFHKTVDENARLALGGAIDLVDQVVTGKLQNGMAVIRPPGHHAMSEQYSGYCYFNNVAVAATTALEKHRLKRILIVDWDVHHGQGTQFNFYNDPRVLFFSIHRYEHGLEWPHLRESDSDYIGEGPGKGYNFNVPLNEIGCDNSDYLSIFFNVLLPVAYEFQPELVLVSAGYDSAIGCPEGQMSVTPACFAHFVNLLKSLACGKLVLLLEGGYCLKTLAESSALSLRALLGDPTPNITPITHPKNSVVESVLNLLKEQHTSHPSLAYQDLVKEGETPSHTWQSYDRHHSHEELRTRDMQPESFPLIQECCELVSEATQGAIDQQIEQLDRDTIIASTQHRLGLLHYHLEGHQNGKSASLEDVLSEKGLLHSCQRLSSKELTSSSRALVSAAVGAILTNKVQSCIMLPSDSATTTTKSCSDCQELVKTVAGCLQSDIHDVKRTLFLNISSHGEIVGQNIMMAGDGLLVVSLGTCAVSGAEELAANCRPVPVNIPLVQNQLNDSDVIAAVQQILLPVTYEFGPDFLVVCLDSLKSDIYDERPSAACLGHVMTMLQGLARGRILLLVTPAAVTESPELVVECVSILQGGPCQMLPSCIPQQSTVNQIKDVQDNLRAVWKTLQYREKLAHPR